MLLLIKLNLAPLSLSHTSPPLLFTPSSLFSRLSPLYLSLFPHFSLALSLSLSVSVSDSPIHSFLSPPSLSDTIWFCNIHNSVTRGSNFLLIGCHLPGYHLTGSDIIPHYRSWFMPFSIRIKGKSENNPLSLLCDREMSFVCNTIISSAGFMSCWSRSK